MCVDDISKFRTRRCIGNTAFSVAVPQTWNRQSTELKQLLSTESFRQKLKTHSSILPAWLMELRTPLFYFVMHHRSVSRGRIIGPKCRGVATVSVTVTVPHFR